MKNSVFLVFFSLIIFLNTSKISAQADSHKIQVKINGLKDTVCILAHYYGKNQYIAKDTARVDSKGNMVFNGKGVLPGGIYLLVLPNRYMDMIVVEQNFSLETDTANLVSNMKVKGSKENEIFFEYQKYMGVKGKLADSLSKKVRGSSVSDSTKIINQLQNLDKEVKTFRKNFFEKHAGTFTVKILKAAVDPEIPEAPILPNGRPDSTFAFRYYKAHYFDNFDFTDERMLRTPFFHSKIEKYMKNLTLQIPDSIVKEADFMINKARADKELFRYCVWYVTNTYETSEIMGMDAVFVHMAEKYYLSGDAYWIDETAKEKIKERFTILKPLLLGKKIPNMYLADTTGKIIELHKFQAKTTIIFFYDPECGHCKKETPKLYALSEKLKSKGVMVYAATIERKPDAWKKFIKEFKLYNWTNVWDMHTATDFRNKFDVYSTPVIYILDKDKKIIAKRLSVDQIEDFLENYEKIAIK